MSGRLILIADDFALSDGVSRAICDLAEAGRLSGTSALVTQPGWQRGSTALRPLRERLAVGLHFNLTLGTPLGAMPHFAASGVFPNLGTVVRATLTGRIPAKEIEAEFNRQLDVFEAAWGSPPDFIDGHQHVHVFPQIRDCVFRILQSRPGFRGLFLRDPSDSLRSVIRRGVSPLKAIYISHLARGFGRRARQLGFLTNDSFAGISSFDPAKVALEFARSATRPGQRHLVMCHPGYADGALATADPMGQRRQSEFDFLAADNALTKLVWRPHRAKDGTIVWPGAGNTSDA